MSCRNIELCDKDSYVCWWRVSPGWANTTTVMNEHAKPSRECSLSIPCVPSMNITGIFIGGVSPSKCNFYSTSLQRLYFQNIPGRTCNFPITVVSGLQLRWALLLQAAFFATITLAAVSEDIPSFAGQHNASLVRPRGAFG